MNFRMLELPCMPLTSGPCFSRVSRLCRFSNSVLFILFKFYFGRSSNTLVPASPNLSPDAHAAPAAHDASLLYHRCLRDPFGPHRLRDLSPSLALRRRHRPRQLRPGHHLGDAPPGDPPRGSGRPGCRPSLPRARSSGRLVGSHHPARFAPRHTCVHYAR